MTLVAHNQDKSSLFFLNGRADKILRIDSGAILAVITGYCRIARQSSCVSSRWGSWWSACKKELPHGRHEGVSGRLSSSHFGTARHSNPRTNYIAHIYRANRGLNYDSNIQLGVLNTFLIHKAGIDAKQMAAEEKCSGVRVCFIEWMVTDSWRMDQF